MRVTAFDFETELIRGLSDKVSTQHHVPRAVCLAVSDGVLGMNLSEAYSAVLVGRDMAWYLEACLADGHVLVGHNVAFDIGVSIRLSPELEPLWRAAIREGRVYDTRVLYQLRHVPRDTPRTLQHVAEEVCGITLEKDDDIRLGFRVGEALSEADIAYAQGDADATLAVFERCRSIPLGGLTRSKYTYNVTSLPRSDLPAAPVEGLTPSDRLFSSAAAVLALELAPRGVAVDLGALASVRAEYAETVDRLSAELARAGLAQRTRAQGPVEPLDPQWVASVVAEAGRAWTLFPAHDIFVRRAGNQKDGYRYEQCPSEGWKLKDAPLRAAHQAVALEHKLRIPLSEKTGKITLSYDEWKLHRPLLPDALQTYLDLGRARKYLTAFLDPLAAAVPHQDGEWEELDEPVPPDLRVYPNYWIPGAETTRWACSKPNLQQLPKKLRSLYVADPGDTFVYADYSTLELYTLAHCMYGLGICGTLMKQLERGVDIHIATAAMIYEVPESQVTPAQRQTAKALNFGLPGGLGIARLFNMGLQQYGLSWEVSEADALRQRWFEVYSDVALFLDKFRIDPYKQFCPPGVDYRSWIEDELKLPTMPTKFELSKILEDGQLYKVTLPGGLVIPRRRFSQAANCVFQATGAEVITRAFLNCVDRGIDVAAVVHDSITAVAGPGDRPEEVGGALVAAMRDAQATVCPTVPSPLPEFELGPTLM